METANFYLNDYIGIAFGMGLSVSGLAKWLIDKFEKAGGDRKRGVKYFAQNELLLFTYNPSQIDPEFLGFMRRNRR